MCKGYIKNKQNCECVSASCQGHTKVRQSDETSAKHGKVSNHGCQLPTKERQQHPGPTVKSREHCPRVEAPLHSFKGALILGQVIWEKYASDSSGGPCHVYMTVLGYSLLFDKKGLSLRESCLLSWCGLVLFQHLKGEPIQFCIHFKPYLSAFHCHHLSLKQ